ncbi:MAG: hypothetical protein IMY67_08165, partial [Bacteroidetes bacterium]|nr:hypothetical protein [Bacteroidota bacterium]
KHATDLGYTDKELLNISASVFFRKEEFPKIKEAIKMIFERGWNEIYTEVITKNKKHVPYYFQGYQLTIDDEKYYMGVGINMSKENKLKNKLTHFKNEHMKLLLKQRLIDNELQLKKRELLIYALQESQIYKSLYEARKKINLFTKKHQGIMIYEDLEEISRILNQEYFSKNQWETFKQRFVEIHGDFYIRLKENHPDLTTNELRVCAYLRIQLTSFLIMSILNISTEGLRKSRYRIRKKIGLERKESLDEYIIKF